MPRPSEDSKSSSIAYLLHSVGNRLRAFLGKCLREVRNNPRANLHHRDLAVPCRVGNRTLLERIQMSHLDMNKFSEALKFIII